MERIDIAYIGCDYRIAEYIFFNDKFNLKIVLCEEERLNKEIILFSEVRGIKLYIIESLKSFIKKINKLKEYIFYYVIYNFSIIIPSDLIEKCMFFNIHPGSLISNRGRNPLEKSLLNNEKTSEISLYKISDKIDLGEFISSKKFYISLMDDNLSLQDKIYHYIPNLLESLYEYITNNLSSVLINEGKYNSPIQKNDFTINIEKDSLAEIYNKIRSQKKYNGAILKISGKEYFIKDIKDIRLNKQVKKIDYDIQEYLIVISKGKYILELSY